MVNPASALFNEDVYRNRHLLYDLADQSSSDANSLPYAFHPTTLQAQPPGFMVWLPMDQPQAIFQQRLVYLKDAGFLGSRAQMLTLQFAAVDVVRSALVYVRLVFTWTVGGTIEGEVVMTGMPVTTLSSSFWVRSQMFAAIRLNAWFTSACLFA
jgi:hypothetical protein